MSGSGLSVRRTSGLREKMKKKKRGRPKGSKNRATIESMRFLRSNSPIIHERALELALGRDPVYNSRGQVIVAGIEPVPMLLKEFIRRTLPTSLESFRKERLPNTIKSVKEAKEFAENILDKFSSGEISIQAANQYANLIERYMNIISVADIEERVKELESNLNA